MSMYKILESLQHVTKEETVEPEKTVNESAPRFLNYLSEAGFEFRCDNCGCAHNETECPHCAEVEEGIESTLGRSDVARKASEPKLDEDLSDILKMANVSLSEDKQSYKPPKSAQNNAKKVLKWKKEHGDEVTGMTQTGWTRANQLASGEELSLDTVKRMAAFARHKKNAKVADEHRNEPWKDNGYVAWLGWGGDSGINWAKSVSEKSKDDK